MLRTARPSDLGTKRTQIEAEGNAASAKLVQPYRGADDKIKKNKKLTTLLGQEERHPESEDSSLASQKDRQGQEAKLSRLRHEFDKLRTKITSTTNLLTIMIFVAQEQDEHNAQDFKPSSARSKWTTRTKRRTTIRPRNKNFM